MHEGKGKFDTFIFGSSRVQKFNPKLFSESAYNLGYSAGLPFDYLRDLKNFSCFRHKNQKNLFSSRRFLLIRDYQKKVSSNINFVGYSGFSDKS